jgi:hypothetical protein
MTDTTVLTTDMAILIGIFLLGFLAKLFPRTGHRQQTTTENRKHRSARRD